MIPAGIKQINGKASWFNNEYAKELEKKGVEFGFQIIVPADGDLSGLPQDFSLPFGFHLPHFLSGWYRHHEIDKFQRIVESVTKYRKHRFAVLHGMSVDKDRRKYNQENTENENNFVCSFSAKDWLNCFYQQASCIKELMRNSVKVAFESVSPSTFTVKNGDLYPHTYLDLRIGSTINDLTAIQKETGCDLVIDEEHLRFALNYIFRYKNYLNVPIQFLSDMSQEENRVLEISGFFVRQGAVLRSYLNDRYHHFMDERTVIETEWEKQYNRQAKVFHLCGFENGDKLEYSGGKVTSHSPIMGDDDLFLAEFRKIVQTNKDNDCNLVLEVSNSYESTFFSDRPYNSQEISFYNVCKMLISCLEN